MENDTTESCFKCKHIVLKSDMKEVICRDFSSVWLISKESRWYCPEHTPAYENIDQGFNFKARYYKEIEVDESGIPIGYEKIVENNKK